MNQLNEDEKDLLESLVNDLIERNSEKQQSEDAEINKQKSPKLRKKKNRSHGLDSYNLAFKLNKTLKVQITDLAPVFNVVASSISRWLIPLESNQNNNSSQSPKKDNNNNNNNSYSNVSNKYEDNSFEVSKNKHETLKLLSPYLELKHQNINIMDYSNSSENKLTSSYDAYDDTNDVLDDVESYVVDTAPKTTKTGVTKSSRVVKNLVMSPNENTNYGGDK
jgi:hypothetical protein